MKSSKELIIELLIHDMKHSQLLTGLHKLGFSSEMHDTDICGIVAELMDIPEMEMSWDWAGIYLKYVRQSEYYEITNNGKNLLPLAETCYNLLIQCANKEKESSH